MSWKKELAASLDLHKNYTIKDLETLSGSNVQNLHQSLKRWRIRAVNTQDLAHKYAGRDLVIGMSPPVPARVAFEAYQAIARGETKTALDLLRAYLPERVIVAFTE